MNVAGHVTTGANVNIAGIMTSAGVLSQGGGGNGTIEGNLNVSGTVRIDGVTEVWNNEEGEYIRLNTHIHGGSAGPTGGPMN
jgi:hypothetical protein